MQPSEHLLPLSLAEKGDVTLHILDWGDAAAAHTVMCVHGLTRNAHDFDILAQSLASEGKRVLALDMPGRGESPWLADPLRYDYALYATACVAVMDNFHLRAVDWIGTSMGGIIGMLIAAHMRKRIRRLVLNDIGVHISHEGFLRIIDYLRDMPRHFIDKEAATVYLKQAFAPFGITDETVWQAFVDHSIVKREEGGWRLKTDPAILEPIRVGTKDFTEIHAVDLSAVWQQVKCPTLILRGEDSDLLSPETMKAMLSSHIKARAETIKGCGHAPSLTTPAQIATVSRFLTGNTGIHATAIGA